MSTSFQLSRYPASRFRNLTIFRYLLITTVLLIICICGLIVLDRLDIKVFSSKTCDTEDGCSASSVLKPEMLQVGPCQEICTSKQCVKAAAYIAGRMDRSADPCEDFHRFSCGNFLDTQFPVEGVEMNSFVQDLLFQVKLDLKNMIESIPMKHNESIPETTFHKIRRVYNHCINPHSSDSLALPSLKKFLSGFGLGEWPHLKDDWIPQGMSMEELMGKFASLKLLRFLRIWITRENLNGNITNADNDTNATTLTIKLDDSYQLFTDIMNNDNITAEGMKKLQQYRKVAKDIYLLMGVSETKSDILVDEVLDFEAKLANISQHSEDDNSTENWEEFNCFNGNDSTNIWCQVLKYALTESNGTDLISNATVVLGQKVYLEFLEEILNDTPKRLIGNYISLWFVFRHLVHLSLPFRRLYDDNDVLLPRISFFDPSYTPRWEQCVRWLSNTIAVPLAGQYMEDNMNSTVEQEVRGVFVTLRETAIFMVHHLTWMNEEMRNSIKENIGEIDWREDRFKRYTKYKDLEKYYEKLKFEDESYFLNVMEFKKFRQIISLQSALNDNPEYSTIAYSSPFDVSASYGGKEVSLSLGILRFPVFVFDRPRYLTYGTLGACIGHELGHGIFHFADTSKNKSSEETLQLYTEKITCLTDQYSKYEIDLIGENVHGNDTLDENFADQISVNSAFLALQRYIEEHGEEAGLPGLPYNNKQLFFIAYAQLWCEVRSKKGYERYLEDRHSPFEHRIKGPLINFPAFAETFACPVGSPMNPADKCNFIY